MTNEDYQNQTDEELIARLRMGQLDVMDYLMEKYKNLVRKKANTMFLLGGDTDDLIQEGMIGLFKAVRDFDDTKESSFFHFAELCITRQIYTAVEAAARKKHGPLNSYISLSADAEDTASHVTDRQLWGAQDDPESLLIRKEDMDGILKKIYSCLSNLEQSVLSAYLEGENYHQIAKRMGKTEKSIDNALQRIKTKISKFL